ncbi:hypothetical protein [Campylobacter sp. JMF_08 NE1]|uniref:hypothetical protein n=1 Tax=Campylobacter sp. JMF_08 NE1 TaxID=2983821 RepID=UPI0022E9ED44|nr:hypothetical protein [Campylobacter sp. JMF_08 NE1]MDA3047334.1 hypothetical protein [Campylobacter sp. JMF_08 NE1]
MKIHKKTKILLIALSIIAIVGLPIIGYLNFIGYSFRHHKILTKDELLQIFTQDEFEFQVYVIESYNQENHGNKFYELDKNLAMDEMILEISEIINSHIDDNGTFDLFKGLQSNFAMKDITQEILNINEKIPYYKEDAQIIADYNKESHGNWVYAGFSKINYPVGKTVIFDDIKNFSIYPSDAFEIKECEIPTSFVGRLLGKSKYCRKKKTFVYIDKCYKTPDGLVCLDSDLKEMKSEMEKFQSGHRGGISNAIWIYEIPINNDGINKKQWRWQWIGNGLSSSTNN